MGDQRVAVVTGASRGAGRGIAIALGAHGYTVYVTGRTLKEGDAALPGTIYETAEAVTAAGGTGIPVRVDHASDTETKALFDQVAAEQGRLDILVNNVAYIDDELILPGGFWEKTLDLVKILDVGLRSQYVASYYARADDGGAKEGPDRLHLVLRLGLLHAWRGPMARRRPGSTSSPPTWRSTSRTITSPPSRSGWAC